MSDRAFPYRGTLAAIVGTLLISAFIATQLRTSGPLSNRSVITGYVRGAEGPLAAVVVRYQGLADSTITDEQGQFTLPALTRIDAIITASLPGYFIGSTSATESPCRLELVPLPEEDNQAYRWVDPTPDSTANDRCGNCHREIYEEWHAGGHASSATNRRFLNLFDGSDWEQRPGIGPSLLADHPHGTAVCAACHLPGTELDDPAVADPRRVHGVASLGVHCDYCHKVHDVAAEGIGLTHGRFGMTLLRPTNGQLFFGPLDDVDRGEDTFSAVQLKSRFCATCHEGIVFGIHVYSTYSEWLVSPAARQGRTCQSCHMAPTGQMTNIAPGNGGIERDPRTLSSHSLFADGHDAMLKRSLEWKLSRQSGTEGEIVTVQVIARNVGHSVPTGFIDRHLLLVVDFLSAEGQLLPSEFEPRLPAAAGAEFAGRPGRLFARLLTVNDGSQPIPFWRATGDPLDTRLRPEEAVSTQFPVAKGSQAVRVRLLYRRFWPATSETKSWPDDTLVIVDERRSI